MTYRIVEYIKPWEIDDLERQINTMILSSYSIQNPKDIIWEVTMNLDCVDWENSKIDKSYFENKFYYLKKIVSYYFSEEFNTDSSVKGCVDIRRNCYSKKQDHCIWLDPDIYFSYLTLPYLIKASESIEDKDFILSPQIIKYWDNSWDSIVHDKFLNEPYNHRDYFDLYSLTAIAEKNQIAIKVNSDIKMGGGWFNLFSDSLIKKLPIPVEFGPYGHEDTYVSHCSKKVGAKQYILSGIVVSEIGKKYQQDKDYIRSLLSLNIQEKTKISDQEAFQYIRKFYESN